MRRKAPEALALRRTQERAAAWRVDFAWWKGPPNE